MKTCKKCGETKALELFNKLACAIDGHNNYCKTCTNEWSRQYCERHPEKRKARYQNNKAKYKAKAKAWHAANPEKVKASEKKHRNSDRHKAVRQVWNKANMEKLLENSKRWAKANPERRREIVNNWNAKNKPHLSERVKRWRKANNAKLLIQSSIRSKKEVNSLSDRYVRYSLLGFKISDNVPKELIEVKRLEMLIKRKIRHEKCNRTTE